MADNSGSNRTLSARLRPIVIAVLVTGLVVFVTCFMVWYHLGGGAWRSGVSVSDARLGARHTLILTVDSCQGAPQVAQLHETDVDVQVEVIAFSTPLHGGTDCLEVVNAYLEEPLRDRMIVDKHSGRIVPSEAGNGAPGSQSTDSQVFVSDNGFIKVGIGTNVDDVYPPGLNPSCVPPGPGYPLPADLAPRSDAPPVPSYLPEGSVLDKEHHSSEGRHIASTYVGPSNNFRVTITHGICGGGSIPAEANWELENVEGHWGILFEGACFEGSDGGCDWDPDFARTLWIETDRGYVELSSVIYPLDKAELMKIAESLPVFDS